MYLLAAAEIKQILIIKFWLRIVQIILIQLLCKDIECCIWLQGAIFLARHAAIISCWAVEQKNCHELGLC